MGRKTDVKHLDTYKRMSHGRQPNKKKKKKKKVFVSFFFPDTPRKEKTFALATVFINAGALSNALHGEVLNKNERLTQHQV